MPTRSRLGLLTRSVRSSALVQVTSISMISSRITEWIRGNSSISGSTSMNFFATQTLEDMHKDLETAVSLGVSHITHYELNVGGRTDFSTNHAATLPSIKATLAMFHASREYLSNAGYRQVTTYDCGKPDDTLHFEETGRRALAVGGEGAYGSDLFG